MIDLPPDRPALSESSDSSRSFFRDKRVLLISPQPWNHIHVSKHHYALELARRGNTVYFLEPPCDDIRSIQVVRVPGQERIHVVRYRPQFPFKIRFHARPFFDFLIRSLIRQIRKSLGEPIDVVWCFEFNLFSNLRRFGADVAIYHPVDPVSTPHQINVARSADVVLSVSESILSQFEGVNENRWLVNHGLAGDFVELAESRLHETYEPNNPIRAGYVGNLLRPSVDRPVVSRLVEEFPLVEFHFWGPNSGGSTVSESNNFISFLRSQPNVVLHGVRTPTELAREICSIDFFLLAYCKDVTIYDRSNSHKLLEYLSTGRVTISSPIDTYRDKPELILMPDGENNDDLPRLFRHAIRHLPELNASASSRQRIEYALDNQYSNQIDRIASHVQAASQARGNAPRACDKAAH
jgi:glycosyltransferase involved in cell wall biosynthesis